MQILSIDVGLNNLGVALLNSNTVIKTKLYKEKSKDSLEKRLFNIFNNLDNFISTEFNLDSEKILVYEKPYFSFNSDTGKSLDYVVGIIHYLSYKSNFKLYGYTATHVKKLIKIEKKKKDNTRLENKELVKDAIEKKLNSNLSNISDHEIDAIAIGFCYLIENQLMVM